MIVELLEKLKETLLETTAIEIIATTISIVYLILISRKNRTGWAFAFISSILFAYLSFSVHLYIESALQMFYVFMALYGWRVWSKQTSTENFIVRWKFKRHVFNVLVSTFVSLALGFLMSAYTSQNNPYLDAFTTVFSLSATFMAAHRVLENWWYWIVIDGALIFLYAGQGLYFVGFNYFLYTIIAIFASFSWYKSYKLQTH